MNVEGSQSHWDMLFIDSSDSSDPEDEFLCQGLFDDDGTWTITGTETGDKLVGLQTFEYGSSHVQFIGHYPQAHYGQNEPY